jgi:hypothetical protein
MDFLQLFKAPANVWGGKDPSEGPKVGVPPPVPGATEPGTVGPRPDAAQAAAGLHPDHAQPPSAELEDVRGRIELKRSRLLQAQADGDDFQVEDLRAQIAELEGKYAALGGKATPMASFAAASPKPVVEEKPVEDPEIAKNRALLAANQAGEGADRTLTPGQVVELETHLIRYDEMPGGVAQAEAELPVLDAAAQSAAELESQKRAELAAHESRASEDLPYHERHALELQRLKLQEELAELEKQTQAKLDAHNARVDERDHMQALLDESKAFLEREQKGFDLSMPEEPKPGEPFDMEKHRAGIVGQISGLREEQDGLDARTDAEFASLSQQIDDPATADEARLAARERREQLEAVEDRKRDELEKQERDLSADLKASYDLLRAAGGQAGFETVAAANQSNDLANRDQAERQIEALREALAADGGLKASLGADHARLCESYPEVAASFPRLGYTADQRRWLEQRIAYLEKRAGELPRKLDLDRRAAAEEASKNPPKTPEELAAEQREQNLELVRALSGPDAQQDPTRYVLGLDKMIAAAETVDTAPAQIETQGQSIEELRAREAELTTTCNSSEEHLKFLEASRSGDHDVADIERRMEEHARAQRELLEVTRKLEAAGETLDELQAKLRAANQELEGPAQIVDITDAREKVGVGDAKIEDARRVLYDAMETDFGKLMPAESDRVLNDIVERARPSVSLFLDPAQLPKPSSLEEVNLLLVEYHKRLGIHRTLGEPAREKMQGTEGEKVWHDRNGQPAVTAEMFGPELGLTPGQLLVMEEEVAKLKAIKAQLDGSAAELKAAKQAEEAGEKEADDREFAEFAERHDDDLVGRYNLVLGRINDSRAGDQTTINGNDILDHMNLGAAVNGLKSELWSLTTQIKRARRDRQPTDELVAQRSALLEKARQLQQEYVKKGDAMIARAAELTRDLPDELKAHVTAKGQAADRQSFEGLIKQIQEDEKLEGAAAG